MRQYQTPAADTSTSAVAIFAVVATVAYLCLELAFNARLLDVAGSLSTASDLHQIEWQGRSLAGVGASLVVWRLVVGARMGLRRSLGVFVLVAACVGPSVYWGQKLLIDWLVEQSDTKQRREATLAVALTEAMHRQVAGFRTLAMDERTGRTAGARPSTRCCPCWPFPLQHCHKTSTQT